jgi:hypothetical protein
MNILLNPVYAIQKAKKNRSVDKSMSILMLSWVMVSMGFFATLFRTATVTLAFVSSLTAFIFGIVFSMFLSYIIDVIMNLLGGKGKYFDSLSATAYSSLPFSVGVLITALLSLVSPILGGAVGFVSLSITVAMSLSIYFRAIKEFYATDITTAFVGFLIVLYVLFIALYVSLEFSMGAVMLSSFPMKLL